MAGLRTTLSARITQAGLHHWPGATVHRSYLAAHHRHLFHVTAYADGVPDDHRALEFHDLGSALRRVVLDLGAATEDPHLPDYGSHSCEHLARAALGALLDLDLPVTAVEWSEDGEYTARVERIPG